MEEIVVTASKRRESIQDVAVSISAIGAQDIERKNYTAMSDYLRLMPGVNMIDMGAGRNAIFMRGIAADPQFESRTVGVYFGEIPVSVLSQDNGAADLKMVDIERVEVLRGPQGTLYGSGSMGGTVRVIPKSANLQRTEGGVGGMYSFTDKGGGDNNEIHGMFNLPIIEGKLGVRAVAYQYDTSGFVRNISARAKAQVAAATGAVLLDKEVGSDTTRGVRLSALWQATEALSFSYMYAQQKIDMDGRPEINLDLDDYQQARFSTIWGDEMQLDDIRAHNFIAEYDFGWARLSSSTSWVKEAGRSNRNFLGTFWEVLPLGSRILTDNKAFTEELRLSSTLQGKWQYVLGLYYDDIDRSGMSLDAWNGDPALSAVNGFGVNSRGLGDFGFGGSTQQKAAFAEATYDLTSRLALTAGARVFDYKIASYSTSDPAGFFYSGYEESFVDSAERNESYKVNLSFKPNEDTLLYVQWSQGFRLGRPLSPPPAFCDVNRDGIHDDLGIPFPRQLNSDFLDNYEVGAKLAFADRRVIVNTSVYSIDWDGIPVYLGVFSPCGGGVDANAGSAKSRGAELEAAFYPTDHLRLDLAGSYADTELGTAIPGGNVGDRLPGSPKYNYNVGVQYDFDVTTRPTYVRGDYAYVSGFFNNFQQLGAEAGDYAQLNLKAGVEISRLNLAVFVNNLLNEDSLTWVDAFPPTASQLRPRTMGVSMDYRF